MTAIHERLAVALRVAEEIAQMTRQLTECSNPVRGRRDAPAEVVWSQVMLDSAQG
jgi:hypothetical protein